MNAPWAAVLLALAAASAAADEPRAQVEQKVALAARLIADAPTVQRIAASGNVRALAHHDESRLHQQLAEEALQRGDLPTARREADEALRHVAQARRLAPDAPAQQAAARVRGEQLRASLERLLAAWRQRAGPQETEDGDLVAALGLIGTARHFTDLGRHEDALHTLAQAEGHVLAGMRRVLGTARELDYTPRAASPAEAYRDELARHDALAELVPLAVAELKPRGDAAALIGRQVDSGRALRAQARQRFEAGDPEGALGPLRQATQALQRALAAAGVSMPADSGGAP